MKYLLPAIVAVFALAGLAGPSDARLRQRAVKPLSAEAFALKAANSNEFEIQSSQLALQKSHNDEIRKFAQRMIDDHTKLADEAKATLQQANLQEPPAELDREHQVLLNKLKNENGAAFDRTYVRDQRTGHQQAVLLLEGYAKSGDNAPLKQLASKALPIVKEHLKLVEGLHAGGAVSARR
jgi:putative membrane protein